MSTVTLEKTEYSRIKRQAHAYQRLAENLFNSLLRDPVNEVVEDFRTSNLYSENFLNDLENGLRRSSYGKR